ncbi:MAG: ABC transporter ATP-binding protein [Candidatus Aminicenantes bacterium]|nr:ABC transporter ATP-binding protein [Candidatus Aminicenantes bacterium]
MSKILEAKNLSVYYGTVRALEDVSFSVNQGEIVSLLGPNGAGKSTALKAICGLAPIKKGEIFFQDKSINGLTPDRLVKKGLCLVPEGRRIFTTMTVIENLKIGGFTLSGVNNLELQGRLEKVFHLFPILKERKKQKAGTLSSGEQQMLAIGRALILKPSLLLLDEPSLGLSPNYVEKIFKKLLEINKNGTSLLIVEQNVMKALEICHRGYVIEMGAIAFEGKREGLFKYENIMM